MPLVGDDPAATVLFWVMFGAWLGGELALMSRTDEGDVRSRDATTYVLTLTVFAGIALAIALAAADAGPTLPGNGWWPVLAGAALVAAGYALRVWSVRTLGRFFKYRVVVQDAHEVVD